NRIYDAVNPNGRSIIFLRVGRIGAYYRKSGIQLIRLVADLRRQGLDCVAVFVGTVEDRETLDRVRRLGGNFTYIFSDEEVTRDAKRVVQVADVVLGTGRSFMEAASLGKILLCPTSNG